MAFDWFIILAVLINTILQACDSPLDDPFSKASLAFKYIDYFFLLLFFIEATMKIIALGFIWSSLPKIKPYLLNGWNLLDFSVLIISIIDFLISLTSKSINLKAIKSLWAIWAIWPLRMFSKNEGLKIVVNSLLSSIPQIINVIIVIFVFIIIFSIMGVSLFAGWFFYCDIENVANLINTK